MCVRLVVTTIPCLVLDVMHRRVSSLTDATSLGQQSINLSTTATETLGFVFTKLTVSVRHSFDTINFTVTLVLQSEQSETDFLDQRVLALALQATILDCYCCQIAIHWDYKVTARNCVENNRVDELLSQR